MNPSTTPPGPPKAPPGRWSVSSLRKGEKITGATYLVETANFKQTRNNKNFIQMSLRDRTGAIKAVRWEATQELYDSFSSGDYLRVTGRVEEFQQNLQVIVDELVRLAPETVDHEQFLPVSPRPLEVMERELMEEVAALGDPHLKALLSKFLEDPELRSSLLRCPAGK